MEDQSRAKLMPLQPAKWLLGLMAASMTVMPGQATRHPSPDALLEEAARTAAEGNPDRLAELAAQAAAIEPKSRLAHWLQAQAVLSLSGQASVIRKPDQDLLSEARARAYVRPNGMLPDNIVYLSQSASMGGYLLLADLAVSRIYVFRSERGAPKLVDEFYTTLGLSGAPKLVEGDRKTPIGAYRLLKEIKNPRADGFLGRMAMTLDYPNAEDRQAKRTGYGIWIHGVPEDVHVRPPKASDGCLAVANDDMIRLKKYVEYGKTHIVITPEVRWITPAEWTSRAVAARGRMESSLPGTLAIFEVDASRPVVSLREQAGEVQRVYWSRKPANLPSDKAGDLALSPLIKERL